MKTSRRSVVAQPTPVITAGQTHSHVHRLLCTLATGLGGPARRASGIVRKLSLLWLFALPLFAHAVAQSGPVASSFGVTTPVTSTTGTATLPNFQLYQATPACWW